MSIMRLKTMRYMCLCFVLSYSCFISCKLKVPIKEMSLAKSAISTANEVKAKKYAPEELNKAKEQLFKCHESVNTDDVKTAKERAVEAKMFADAAIEKSLPPLTSDLLAEARKVYDEADLAFAEKYEQEAFNLADDNIREAETMIINKKLYDAYLKLKEAIHNGTYAKNKALENIPELNKNIAKLLKDTEDLKSKGGVEFAPLEIEAINSKLEAAKSSLDQKNIKDAFYKISEADKDLQIAVLKTKMGHAAKMLKTAEIELARVKESELRQYVMKDIERASLLITEGKELFDGKSYSDSSKKSQEALELISSIWIDIKKKEDEIQLAEEKERERQRIEAQERELKKKEMQKRVSHKEYVVKLNPKKRDCLWRIAYYVYKNARLWPLIYMANRDMIKDPDLIFPGQKFDIPPIPERGEGGKQGDREDVAIREKPAEVSVEPTEEEKGGGIDAKEGPTGVPVESIEEDKMEDSAKGEGLGEESVESIEEGKVGKSVIGEAPTGASVESTEEEKVKEPAIGEDPTGIPVEPIQDEKMKNPAIKNDSPHATEKFNKEGMNSEADTNDESQGAFIE
ncbi:MAG: DUF4398 domain-containing protein [Spirochaetota bacterium]|nr:DUF4398 domain-containing protein [Spirochaetota bacterium]